MKMMVAKLEATYELLVCIRSTGGFDYDKKERDPRTATTVGFRNETEETTWRAELRSTMFDVTSGSAVFADAERRGSYFLTNASNNVRLD